MIVDKVRNNKIPMFCCTSDVCQFGLWWSRFCYIQCYH